MKLKFVLLYLSCILLLLACSTKSKSKPDIEKNSAKSATQIMKIPVADGVNIHTTKHGDQSQAIVFIHGWTCDQTYWKNQIDFFKKDYQVISLDLAGHGKSSEGTRKEWTISNLANDVLAVIKALEYDKVHLVGHSLGTIVALKVAVQLDGEKTTFTAVDYLKRPIAPIPLEAATGFMAPFEQDFVNSMIGFATPMFRSDSNGDLKKEIIDRMAKANPTTAIPLAINLVVEDYAADFKSLADKNIKRYIINSDMQAIDNAHYENLGFKLKTISGTGHFLMLEKPSAFNTTLKSYLEEE